MQKIYKFSLFIALLFMLLAFIYALSFMRDKAQTYAIDESLKGQVTLILVQKQERKLSLYHNEKLLKTYSVRLGANPQGAKQIEGDGKTPEGRYFIDSKNPNSRYFLNLGISYPNNADKIRASALNKSAGGDIKIHGLPNGFGFADALFAKFDWTNGCIAVSNAAMQELYEVVEVGTAIVIEP